jgi:hypothetical protein
MSMISGYARDILQKHAMHIFQNLKFGPMSAVSKEDQFKIKEVLLEIYVSNAETEKQRAVRQKALERFRKVNGR